MKNKYPVVGWSYKEELLKVWIKTGQTSLSVVFQDATIEDHETLSGEFENPRRGQASFVLKISSEDKQSGEISVTGGITPADLICGNILPSGMEEK